MGKQKFYAVKVGKMPGIYQSWSEAEKQVKGFPGAKYKSFFVEEDAAVYLSSDNHQKEIDVSEEKSKVKKENIFEKTELQDFETVAFVNGSQKTEENGDSKCSFGVLLFTNEGQDNIHEAFVSNEKGSSGKIVGEIEGVKQAVLWAIEKEKQNIKIVYNFEGIEKWITKEWQTRTKTSKAYVAFFEEYSKQINIEFESVKDYSRSTYNNQAKKLAKQALVSSGYKTRNDGSVLFYGVQSEEWDNIINILKNDISDGTNTNEIEVFKKSIRDKEIIELYLEKDKVVITCYSNNKSYVQGRLCFLFQKVVTLAIESLPKEKDALNVLNVLNSYHYLSIKPDELEKAFLSIMPNFPIDESDTKLRNTLLQAVYNTMITGYLADCTFLLMPLFRAMEYYLHRILGDKLGKSTATERGKNNFSYFSKNSLDEFEYNSSKGSLSEEQIRYLNDLYNNYNKKRHPYSHWSASSMDTQVITNLTTAKELILEGLNVLNKYYILF